LYLGRRRPPRGEGADSWARPVMAAARAPAAREGVGAPEAVARRGGGLRAKQAGRSSFRGA
jgi:hypothetical protein